MRADRPPASNGAGAAPGAGRPLSEATSGHLVHDAALYRDSRELLEGVVPFLLDGLAHGDPALVVAPVSTLELLRAERPDVAGQVPMVDMGQAGRNPGRIIAAVLYPFVAAHGGRRVRMVGEPVWPDRTEAEHLACVQHEALINVAFHGHDVMIRCPYPASLEPRWLEAVARTHPLVGTGERIGPSRGYGDPFAIAAEFSPRLADPPAHADRMEVQAAGLSRLRRWIARHAAVAGLPDHRVAELTIAANELASNSIRHGDGQATVAVWGAGREVVCQVSGRGHITDPLAGRIPPEPDAPGGRRGLLLVHALCDLVRVDTRPSRTAVEARIRR